MEKKVVYVAYDGEQFPTERACAEYELSMNVHRFKKDFLLYDDCEKPVPHNVSWGGEDIGFIRIINPSKELYEYLKERFDMYNLQNPWIHDCLKFKDDLYYWDNSCEHWRSWSDEVETLDIMGKHFQMFTEN